MLQEVFLALPPVSPIVSGGLVRAGKNGMDSDEANETHGVLIMFY